MSRWNGNPILIVVVLSALILSCQSVTDLTSLSLGGRPVADADWPHSDFVPLRESIQVAVGQSLHLESHHVSPAGLRKLEILVNEEPVKAEISSKQGTIFSNELGNIQILADARHLTENFVEPQYPNSEWYVLLIWIGHMPGTYDLSLVVTDRAGRTGEPVTQRIEVE